MNSLEHLMGAYFHQDWDMDGGTIGDTVRAFATGSPALVGPAMSEIDEVLQQSFQEGGLRRLLSDLGCDYYAGDSDDAYRAWQLQVRQLLASEASS